MGFNNIAVFGAGGSNIGYHVLQALVANGGYHVTVVARASSKSILPASVSVVKVNDFEDHSELVQALKGQDVLISAIGFEGNAIQYKLIDAGIDAGVQRFLPSEWGFDNDDPANRDLSPIFAVKNKLADYLRSKQSATFSWTAVATSIWVEWALDAKFLGIDTVEHTVKYWRDGNHPFSSTTLPYAAAAALQILQLPVEQTANKRIFVSAFEASQRQVVAELEKQQGVEYTSIPYDADKTVEEAKAKWAAQQDIYAAYTTVTASIMLPEYGSNFDTSGKQPLLERMEGVALPRLTLESVLREWLEAKSA
ncbi:hypothetical protein LTR85_006046 [Meristemomyces frigidus]|nr:hypothetical protein LTR85_006046 [Meristemomyces frigidus]